MSDSNKLHLMNIKSSLKNITELLLDIRNNRYYYKKNYDRHKDELSVDGEGTWEPHKGTICEDFNDNGDRRR